MEHSVLTFLTNYLSDLNIRYTFSRKKDLSLAKHDLGLRSTILKDASADPYDIPNYLESNYLYFLSDYYHCSYCFFRLPDDSHFLVIGPYLLEDITNLDIHDFMEHLSIPPELATQLYDYYYMLPCLSQEHMFFLLLRNVYRALFSVETPKVHQLDMKSMESNDEFLKIHEFIAPDDPILSKQLLEQRYTEEDSLLDAIMQGNEELAFAILSKTSTSRFCPRTGDELRDQKNLLLSFNTLLRWKAYETGVHPLYIDSISSNYARMIEQVHSRSEANEIVSYMVRSYCNLVEKRNFSSYSDPIRHILVAVDTCLNDDLTLKRFADELFLNTSYLSTLFKKEVGMTLTDYVNSNRIAYARKLLKSTTYSIQDIAIRVGIPDIHYFARLFRRETNMSPRQWRRQ